MKRKCRKPSNTNGLRVFNRLNKFHQSVKKCSPISKISFNRLVRY